MAEKNWGSKEDLLQTTSFISTIELDVFERTILEGSTRKMKKKPQLLW